MRKLSIIIQPFIPHISEEIWSNVESNSLCINESWLVEEVKKKNVIKIAIQINGKTKDIVEIKEEWSKEEVMKLVMSNNKVTKNLSGKNVLREIYVPGKIINLVI